MSIIWYACRPFLTKNDLNQEENGGLFQVLMSQFMLPRSQAIIIRFLTLNQQAQIIHLSIVVPKKIISCHTIHQNAFSSNKFITLYITDRYILFAVFSVLSIHLAFWQNQNSGIMGFQGFAYTSGKIFQLSFCSERFLFLERWKI